MSGNQPAGGRVSGLPVAAAAAAHPTAAAPANPAASHGHAADKQRQHGSLCPQFLTGSLLQVHNVVPPGPAARKRSALLGRFPLGDPGIKKGAAGEWNLVQERSSRPQPRGTSAGPVAWDLKGSLGSGSNVTYQGQPDANTTSSYFMLMKTGPDFTAIPVSGITFRPNDRGGAVALTLEEAEALIHGSAKATEGATLAPKSLKQQEEADAVYDARLKAEAREALGARVDELEALLGEAQRAGGAKQPLVDAEDDDMPDTFDGDLDDLFEDSTKQRRGRGSKARVERGKASGGAAQGGEPQLGEDEAPEDVYKGEEDELRPEAPDEEADWEHENEVQDDDEDIGVANEEYDDDAHMRKKLGLDQEEEEERPAPAEEDAPDPAAAAAATAAAAGGDTAAAAGGADLVDDEMQDSDDYDLSDAEEVDLDDLDAMATKMEMRGNKQAQRGRYQQAAQQAPDPAAVRAGTPPASVAAAAAAGAGKARAASRSPAPPGAAAIAAGGGKGGGQRGRSATPPTQGVPKRRGGAAAADGQAPQSKRPRGNKSPIDAAAAMAAVPTHQEIIQAASAQQMTLQDLVKMFKPRLVTTEALLAFKERMLQVVIQEGDYVRVINP